MAKLQNVENELLAQLVFSFAFCALKLLHIQNYVQLLQTDTRGKKPTPGGISFRTLKVKNFA